MARPAGLEPATSSFVARHSIPSELWAHIWYLRELFTLAFATASGKTPLTIWYVYSAVPSVGWYFTTDLNRVLPLSNVALPVKLMKYIMAAS